MVSIIKTKGLFFANYNLFVIRQIFKKYPISLHLVLTTLISLYGKIGS